MLKMKGSPLKILLSIMGCYFDFNTAPCPLHYPKLLHCFSSYTMCCSALSFLIAFHWTCTRTEVYFILWEAHRQVHQSSCAKQRGVLNLLWVAGYALATTAVGHSLQRQTARPCLLKVFVVHQDSPPPFCKHSFHPAGAQPMLLQSDSVPCVRFLEQHIAVQKS